jgi:hypothetical protein
VWACVDADARAGAPAWVASALGCNHRFRVHRGVYHVRAGVRAWPLSMASARSTSKPHVCPMLRGGGAAARARGARQAHLLHEREGAPRVARPVHGLGDPVRPLGRHRAALDAATAALPVVGRAEPARAWLAPAARPARGRGGVGAARRRPHWWRAGTRATPGSRRCRWRSTGPT